MRFHPQVEQLENRLVPAVLPKPLLIAITSGEIEILFSQHELPGPGAIIVENAKIHQVIPTTQTVEDRGTSVQVDVFFKAKPGRYELLIDGTKLNPASPTIGEITEFFRISGHHKVKVGV